MSAIRNKRDETNFPEFFIIQSFSDRAPHFMYLILSASKLILIQADTLHTRLADIIHMICQ